MSLALYGVSAELIDAIDGLREAPGISGPKYRQNDIDNLSQMILCRNYGKATLELSYLLLATLMGKSSEKGIAQGSFQSAFQDTTQKVWLNFFWLEESITPKRFRAAFTDIPEPVAPYLQLNEQGLTIRLSNSDFTLSPTRIATLASLLEFLVYVDPAVLQQDGLFEQGEGLFPSKCESTVKTLASNLQQKLYQYLADHLQPAQQQRRFRHLWTWLGEYHKGEGKEDRLAINDDVIIRFWKQATEGDEDSLGFRRYRTVAENFFDLRVAIQCVDARKNVTHSMDIELPPEVLQQVLTTSDVDGIDVNALTRMPKFLTKQQAETYQPIVEVGDTASVMALTIMRMRCFGDWQASLVQALRSKSNDHLKELLSEEKQVLTYSAYHEEITQLQMLSEHASDSGFHVLLHCQMSEAFGLVLQRLSDVDLNNVRGVLSISADGEPSALFTETVILAQWPDLLLRVPVLNQLVQQFQKAFKANNRQGFKVLTDNMDCDAYMEGVQLLDRVLQRCDKHLQGLNESCEVEFCSDLSIFKSGFIALYGDRL
ncbi:hypothetical protein A9Q81_19080 [Gammaproteobacteria bacterium 42_54_T18]|nr:hypothetical protein A9Q81_19080 [Gammaproteobacteria bacterium 42_54_T18]